MKYLTVFIAVLIAMVWASPLQNSSPALVPLKNIGSRIINGEDASLGQFPWQVALYLTQASGQTAFCGGSILSDEWVLTAGHCVYSNPIIIRVLAGRIDLDSAEGGLDTSNEFILHDDFNILLLTNDIALIKLTEPLEFTDNIQPISLSDDFLDSDTKVTVSGWGKTSDDTDWISQDLHYVNIVTISNEECSQSYENLINDGMVCAVSSEAPHQSPCNGDSGGPVVTNADSNPALMAVVSFVSSRGCESSYPSGYTRVSTHREWIRNVTGI